MDEFYRALQGALPGLNDAETRRFARYYELLLERNKVMNLTAITEPAEVAKKHFADSALPLEFSLIKEGAKCVDVGTGAGFPGIPLLILRPDIELVLVDALQKRIAFLKETLDALGLKAQCLHARAEDAGRRKELRERFDVALSRAVAPVNVLVELTLPLLKVGGVSLMYKGPAAGEETAAASRVLKLLSGEAAVHSADKPWGERKLVAITKRAHTSDAYPRKAGTPARSPL
ncbi:MAG: 16S rRNA (guanine(527)-N(7))-methyltransferase RsmG [Bacillota bacterium]